MTCGQVGAVRTALTYTNTYCTSPCIYCVENLHLLKPERNSIQSVFYGIMASNCVQQARMPRNAPLQPKTIPARPGPGKVPTYL